MEFAILGPLEVRAEERLVPLHGPRQRALLAILLLHAGETVSTDRLIDLLWGESPPATARKALSVRISQLRKLLDSYGDTRETIVTRAPGYAIELTAEQLDLRRFESLSLAGREALDAGDAAAASELLSAALALWRGPPLADFTFEAFAQAEIARLEELRLGAVEDRIAADLELGCHAQLVGQLEALISEHPLRERLSGQLMLALYRGGRQADALEAYRQARSRLVDELGLEPGRELKAMEQAILVQDPALDTPRRPDEERTAASVRAGSAGAFVGREDDLGELLAALADTRAGNGRLVLVGGEPGIGKSRLAEEFSMRADERGAQVLAGRCWEAGGAPAYWPWVQSLRAYAREREPGELRAELGSGGADVAQLLPELRELYPTLAEPLAQSPDGARFRLFDSVATFLRNAARTRPIVLVLDDLHAADSPSLLLLEFLAGELDGSRLMILGAYRDTETGVGHPLSATLAEVARARSTRRLVLGGLSEAAVGRYIELATGVAAPESLVAALHRGTDGNPLFLTELASLLSDERLLDEGAMERLPIPPGVHDAIGNRLRRLSPDCRSLLGLASGLGREFSLAALERVSPVRGGALLGFLDEARAASVIGAVPGAQGRLRFSTRSSAMRCTNSSERLGGPASMRRSARLSLPSTRPTPSPTWRRLRTISSRRPRGAIETGRSPGPSARAIARSGFWRTRKPPGSTAWLWLRSTPSRMRTNPLGARSCWHWEKLRPAAVRW